MMKLCEVLGLTAGDMGEITGFMLASISFSVFLANMATWFIHASFEFLAEMVALIAEKTMEYIRKKKKAA